MSLLSSRGSWLFISCSGKRKKSRVWEYALCAVKKLQCIVFVSQSGILNLLDFFVLEFNNIQIKMVWLWRALLFPVPEGWWAALSPLCWALREPSAFWYSLLNCISANTNGFLASILSWVGQKMQVIPMHPDISAGTKPSSSPSSSWDHTLEIPGQKISVPISENESLVWPSRFSKKPSPSWLEDKSLYSATVFNTVKKKKKKPSKHSVI